MVEQLHDESDTARLRRWAGEWGQVARVALSPADGPISD